MGDSLSHLDDLLLRADCKWSHNLKIQLTFAEKSLGNEGLQSDSPYRGHLTKSFTNYPPIRVCEFD